MCYIYIINTTLYLHIPHVLLRNVHAVHILSPPLPRALQHAWRDNECAPADSTLRSEILCELGLAYVGCKYMHVFLNKTLKIDIYQHNLQYLDHFCFFNAKSRKTL